MCLRTLDIVHSPRAFHFFSFFSSSGCCSAGFFFSEKEDKHELGVGFLVHKDIVNTVMGCRPVFSRLITIRQRAVPFNISVVQMYDPTSDYDDNELENSMTSYGVSLIRNRRTFLLCKETGIQKWARMLYENWQGICGPFCNDETKERGLRLLEFATFNDLVLAYTFGDHKASRRWTWHSPSGQHH